MAFDTATRAKLQAFVNAARKLLTDEFQSQLQQTFGIQPTGEMAAIKDLKNINDDERGVAQKLHERIEHLVAGLAGEKHARKTAVARVIREQAFTVLNRFVAIRLTEERDIIAKSCNEGFQSKSFRVYEQISGTTIGNQYERYKTFMFCLYDELALDLGVLFDRYSPYGMLFPRQTALNALFDLINSKDLASIYTEDETIGWVYQYWNDPAERKKMRDESASPRDSRELAVRNQFFTPRYVVEFLTDNTLGRIWYEMTQGQTQLKEDCRYLVRRPNEMFLKPGEVAPEQLQRDTLSQEELLKQPVHIAHRPLKDPRTILLLDPACGSMHFGLYAFDLFEVIYAEAWELESTLGPEAFTRDAGMPSLHQSFANKEAFLKEIPRLIIEHNLHGIDIDPRCAQIAGLSLWLRAQKAWQKLGLKALDRPAIKRSNIVCAEPMPGEKDLLQDFVAREFPKDEQVIFLHLLETIFDKMQLAGEAGSLLKIEEEITDAVEAARLDWLKVHEQLPFTDSLTMKGDYWRNAEERLLKALRDYAEHAEGSRGFQRRLFAEDASQGFAFIDLCRKDYDAVVMNPPFGESSSQSKDYIVKTSGAAKADIYTAFLSRWSDALIIGGRMAAITPRSFIYQIDFHDFRKNELLARYSLPLLVELGFGELDGATNRTACFILLPTSEGRDFSQYLMIADSANKAGDLAAAAKRPEGNWIPAYLRSFNLPVSSQLLFRLSATFRKILASLPRLDPVLGKSHKGVREGLAQIVNGLQCPSDVRYVRLAVEVPGTAQNRWIAFSKPLQFCPYVSELGCVVNWRANGAEQKAEFRGRGISPTKYISGENYYPSRGAWFPDVSERGIGASLLPFPVIPGRMGILALGRNEEELPRDALAGFLNSIIAEGVLGLTTPERHHKPSYMGQIPWIDDEECVKESSQHYWSMVKLASIESASELSSEFVAPDIVFHRGNTLEESIENVVTACESARQEMEAKQRAFDDFLLRKMGASAADASLLFEMSKRTNVNEWFPSGFELREPQKELVAALVSYCVGIALGRWNLVVGLQTKAPPLRIVQRESLPICAIGQLQGDDGLPLSPEAVRRLRVEGRYPLDVAWDGILVDDPTHPLDIEGCVRAALDVLWADRADALEREASALLGGPTLREWFRRPASFFADHLKRYSKSRRQAPIYWPLSTRSGLYTIWVYCHRLNDQTLHKILGDFVTPKIDETENVLGRFSKKSAKDLSADERKENEQLKDLLEELQEFKAEITRIIHLNYQPNLNDGVEITAAPLYKLFRLPRWQVRLKETWAKLEEGDYDWAHIALSMWPKRVKEKCKTDKSIAIAHDLEHLYVEPAPKAGKKKAKKSKKSVDQPTLAGFDEDR